MTEQNRFLNGDDVWDWGYDNAGLEADDDESDHFEEGIPGEAIRYPEYTDAIDEYNEDFYSKQYEELDKDFSDYKGLNNDNPEW